MAAASDSLLLHQQNDDERAVLNFIDEGNPNCDPEERAALLDSNQIIEKATGVIKGASLCKQKMNSWPSSADRVGSRRGDIASDNESPNCE